MKRSGWNSAPTGRVLGLVLATALVGGVGMNAAAANKAKSAAAPAPAPYVENPPITSLSGCQSAATAGQAPNMNADAYSLYNQVRDMGADAFYRAGYFGDGVDVAMIDTGVAPVKGIDAGNVVDGPDLSFESQAAYGDKKNADLPRNDTFGHGTHMAGIIAGRDDSSRSTADGHQPYGWTNPAKFTGVAPGARVVSLKVADSVGAVDVTQVIAAIDWVVQHRNDYGLHIRVLNISYGVDSSDSARMNVLAHAVRQAWYAGIVVVAAAGNSGHGTRTLFNLTSPAYDPRIIAVGAYDNNGTPGYPDDDRTSAFSSGDQRRHPDVLAPGAHVLSLHVGGSSADAQIADDCAAVLRTGGHDGWSSPVFGSDGRFVRGSGTSQSAAMVSGAVALLLSKNPGLTPDQVKDVLTMSAREGVTDKKSVRGKGEIALDRALLRDARDVNQSTDTTYGVGRLDSARSRDALPCLSSESVNENRGEFKRVGHTKRWAGGTCSDIANMSVQEQAYALETDVHGRHYESMDHSCDEEIDPNTGDYYAASVPCYAFARDHIRTRPWTSTPSGEVWNGTVWTGTSFASTTDVNLGRRYWNTAAWADGDWLGRIWTSHNWSGRIWTGRFWRGSSWEDSSWLGRIWTGRIWTDHDWTDSSWS